MASEALGDSAPSSYLSEAGETALSQVRAQLERAREVSRRLAMAIYEFKDGTDSQAQVNSLLLASWLLPAPLTLLLAFWWIVRNTRHCSRA